MFKVFVLVMLVICVSGLQRPTTVAAQDPSVYESLRCGNCHQPDTKAVAASLATIAKTYQTREKLIGFFKGESDHLIESDNWGLMRAQMSKLSSLKEEDRQTLADFILSHK